MEIILPTAEEADKIHAGDIELKDKYYLINYEVIVVICRSYCRNGDIPITSRFFEDMSQECYLYFSDFKFGSAGAFVRSVKDVCSYERWGGEKVFHQVRQGDTEILTILDEPAKKDKHGDTIPVTVGDLIPSDFDVIEEIEPEEKKTDLVFETIKKFLTPRQKEAFEWFYYSDMTAREVGAQMGVNINGAQSLKNSLLYRLRAKKDEVKEALADIGVCV